MQVAKKKQIKTSVVKVKQETKPLGLHFGKVISSSSVDEDDKSVVTTEMVVPPPPPLPPVQSQKASTFGMMLNFII